MQDDACAVHTVGLERHATTGSLGTCEGGAPGAGPSGSDNNDAEGAPGSAALAADLGAAGGCQRPPVAAVNPSTETRAEEGPQVGEATDEGAGVAGGEALARRSEPGEGGGPVGGGAPVAQGEAGPPHPAPKRARR